MLLTIVGLLIDISGLVGVWAAYGPTRDSVITVSNTLQQGLQVADKGLTRADGYVTQARQVVTQVNDVVTLLGDNVQKNSPIITALAQRVNTKLAPALDQAQTIASTVHDAALKVNGALVILNRFPGVSVPTFNDQLSAISAGTQNAQSSVQDLRTTLANVKAGVVTKVSTTVTKITARIDAPLAKIQSIIKYLSGKGDQRSEPPDIDNEPDPYISACDRNLCNDSLPYRRSGAADVLLILLAICNPWTLPISAHCGQQGRLRLVDSHLRLRHRSRT